MHVSRASRLVFPLVTPPEKQLLTCVCQRRRNELREGFDRLRDALPASSQRTSKSAILDRAVAHIQQVEASNRFMSEAFEGLRREIDELRVLNNKLVTAMTHAPGSAEASPRTASLS